MIGLNVLSFFQVMLYMGMMFLWGLSPMLESGTGSGVYGTYFMFAFILGSWYWFDFVRESKVGVLYIIFKMGVALPITVYYSRFIDLSPLGMGAMVGLIVVSAMTWALTADAF